MYGFQASLCENMNEAFFYNSTASSHHHLYHNRVELHRKIYFFWLKNTYMVAAEVVVVPSKIIKITAIAVLESDEQLQQIS